jgi:HPt (histidine-containing phosphotransfer) domain-containing protein
MPFPVDPTKPDGEATRKLLASLWERNLPVLRERLAVLDHAVNMARLGTLTAQVRNEALDVAHKLSGSLGMFGYNDATGFARQIEHQLEAVGDVNALQLAEQLAAMRATLSL